MTIDPEPITNWFLLALAVLGTISAVSAVIYKVNRNFERRVTDLITETTLPIQANTNGGLSLSDLHEKVDRIERRYMDIHSKEETARELWHERYLEDQRRIRKEWTAVFIAIRKMIHLPPPDQVVIWDGITQDYINGTIADKYTGERHEDVQ